MTVTTEETSYSQYTGNGTQTYFEYGFTLREGDVIEVYVNGKAIPEASSQKAEGYTKQANGVIIIPAPVLKSIILIIRNTPITQERNFEAFDAFHASWTEDAMDKLILLKQEAARFGSQINLTGLQFLWNIVIDNDKGTGAPVSIWDENIAGVFAGLVTEQMPPAGSFVSKPPNFVYFQYGDTPVLTETLTTTLYPIEVEEKLAITCDLNDGYLQPIQSDEMEGGPSFIGGTLVATLLDVTLDPDDMDGGPSFISGTLDRKLVTTYAPAEKLAITCDLNATECYLNPV